MLVSKKWFSLIEILIGILIISIIMVAAFQSLSAVWIAKVKLVEQTEIEKQAYYSSERFFELIKKWGTLDYEEYWNRYSYDRDYINWHFQDVSGFWNYWHDTTIWIPTATNFWPRLYNCISNAGNMWTDWCLEWKNISFNNSTTNVDVSNIPQRYKQYELQFIDRNSDNDADGWIPGDEDWDGSVVWDDDDLYLWEGPAAFTWSSNTNKVWELYLISNDGSERTYFRWTVTDVSSDPLAPTGASCNGLNTENPNGTWCQGTIEMLKLVGEDYWFDHVSTFVDADGSQNDGIIDTWYIHPDYAAGVTDIVAWSDTLNYWQPIFPNTINIKDFEIYAYPNKDLELSWRDDDNSILVAPYVQVKYTIEPSLKAKAKIKWATPSVDIATTIGLSSLDIK